MPHGGPTPPAKVKIALDAFGSVVALRWSVLCDRVESSGRKRPNDWDLVRDWRLTEGLSDWPAKIVRTAGGTRRHPSSMASLLAQYVNAVALLEDEKPDIQQLVTWLFAVTALHYDFKTEWQENKDGVSVEVPIETGVTSVEGFVYRRWPHMGGDSQLGCAARLTHDLVEFYDISKRSLETIGKPVEDSGEAGIRAPEEPDPPYNNPSAKEIQQMLDTLRAG